MKTLMMSFLAFAMIITSALFSETTTSTIQWTTDYQQAKQKSKSTNKPMVLFFTGSDWCTWCHKLEDEVLKTDAFARAAGDQFIFVKLDFPRSTRLSPQVEAQNKQLASQFNVKGYPTVVLIDSNENVLTTAGYAQGGGERYAAMLKSKVKSGSFAQQKN